MPTHVSLSKLTIANAKPRTKPYMLTDGDGLHVFIDPSGSKLWRMRYRFEGKASMISLGSFPRVSLLDARKKRDDAKRLLANGTNPSLSRKVERLRAAVAAQNTFGAVADEYVANLGGLCEPPCLDRVRNGFS
jgi:Arm DNA-binding domain